MDPNPDRNNVVFGIASVLFLVALAIFVLFGRAPKSPLGDLAIGVFSIADQDDVEVVGDALKDALEASGAEFVTDRSPGGGMPMGNTGIRAETHWDIREGEPVRLMLALVVQSSVVGTQDITEIVTRRVKAPAMTSPRIDLARAAARLAVDELIRRKQQYKSLQEMERQNARR